MLSRENAIVWLPSWLDACGLWRMLMPSMAFRGSSLFIFNREPDFNKIAGNDICIVQRCCTTQQFRFIQVAAAFGMKLVYDLDDNVWDLPDYNPARPVLSKLKDGFFHCMRQVDVVSVSTRTLQKVVQHQVRNLTNARTGKQIPVIVAENRILPKLFVDPVKLDENRVIIGWAGSASHIGDLPLIQPAMEQFAGVPGVYIEIRGIDLPEGNPLRDAPNYRFKFWIPVAEYGARMPVWGWHIALAPVTDHEFNASKSCIKMIEAGYCGIPCLASWVKPYEDFCRWHPDLRWLLCAGASAFASKLRDLVHDKARREYYGGLMQKVVMDHYQLDEKHDGWRAVFAAAREAPKKETASYELTQNLLAAMMDEPGPLPDVGQRVL